MVGVWSDSRSVTQRQISQMVLIKDIVDFITTLYVIFTLNTRLKRRHYPNIPWQFDEFCIYIFARTM